METDWEQLAEDWLDMAVTRGRDAWDSLSGRRQYLVVQTLQDIAKLRVNELAGFDVSEELAIANATMTNLGVIAGIVMARTIMDVINDSLKMAGSIITGILGNIKF